MPIRFYCTHCGQKIKAQDDMSGMRIACPTCRDRQTVPQLPPGKMPSSMMKRADQQDLQLAAQFDPSEFSSAPKGYQKQKREHDVDDRSEPLNQIVKKRIFRGSLYFLFVFAFIPLFLTMVQGQEQNLVKVIEKGIEEDLRGEKKSKAKKAFELAKTGKGSIEDVLNFFPNKKLKSAWLPRDSELHIYLAMVCFIGFMFVTCLCLPKGFSRIPLMLMIAGFTGVFGIGMLLILQFMAMSGWGFIVGGPFAIIIFMIGIAYRSLLNPDLPFINCLMSYTFGVGLCEEIIKALPIFIIFLGRSRQRWHECCALGMASGIGFGIAEGIHFSATMYNGLCDQLMYFVRFISCVMLHAVWCAASALFLHRYQKLTHGGMSFLMGFYRLVLLISIPMVLHGLYDTLLTKHMDGLALAVALASFGWLVLMVESAREKEGDILVEVANIKEEITPLHDLPKSDPRREGSDHAVSPSTV